MAMKDRHRWTDGTIKVVHCNHWSIFFKWHTGKSLLGVGKAPPQTITHLNLLCFTARWLQCNLIMWLQWLSVHLHSSIVLLTSRVDKQWVLCTWKPWKMCNLVLDRQRQQYETICNACHWNKSNNKEYVAIRHIRTTRHFFSKYADHSMAKYAAKIYRACIFFVNLTWSVFLWYGIEQPLFSTFIQPWS